MESFPSLMEKSLKIAKFCTNTHQRGRFQMGSLWYLAKVQTSTFKTSSFEIKSLTKQKKRILYRYEGQQKNKLSYSQHHKNRTIEISTNTIIKAFIFRTSQKGAHNYEVLTKEQPDKFTSSLEAFHILSYLKFVKNFTHWKRKNCDYFCKR